MKRNPISSWLWRNDISFGDVAMATGVSMAVIFATITGNRQDERVVNYLRYRGCPDFIINHKGGAHGNRKTH